ncbi:MAG: hypothetical protein DI585_05085 [Pseudomonas fluorescens]|nr:MAG: hypothetical protein DI585_05085 [Pseudomonas fluorescens]
MNTQVLPLLPAGVTISQWHPEDVKTGEEARAFCLAMIKSVYGYDYRADWHKDLDSLLKGDESWYTIANKGTFLVLRNAEGTVIGTGGIHPISRKPVLMPMFEGRYTTWESVAALGRTYILPEYRGLGMSRVLVAMLEHAAERMGYAHMNLHCEESAIRLRNHWESFGFTHILNEDSASHYDKFVCNSAEVESRYSA